MSFPISDRNMELKLSALIANFMKKDRARPRLARKVECRGQIVALETNYHQSHSHKSVFQSALCVSVAQDSKQTKG